MKIRLTPANVDAFIKRPAGLSPDARELMAAIKPEGEITKDYLRAIADRFQEDWGEERAVAAFTEVVERVEAVASGLDHMHGSDPGMRKEDSVLPATEGDRIFRRSLRKGQQVAIVSRRLLDDGRTRILVTHEKVKAIKNGYIRARTKIDGQDATMDIGILLVYSINKFPNELKRTFADEGEVNDWFSSLEAKEEDSMMAADKITDLRSWRNEARRGTRCEIHIMTSVGQKVERGKVLEPAKKGARIQMEKGNISFKNWNEIYPEGWLELHPAEPPKPKTLGKLGDVIDLKKAVASAPPAFPAVLKRVSIPPPDQCAPQASVPPPAPVPPAPPEPLKLAAPRPERPRRTSPGRGGKLLPHVSTAIGNIFRSERLKRAWNQKRSAAFIGRTAGLISDIELGDTMPDDDTLLAFSERFGINLDLLLSARDGQQEAAADPVLALNRIAELEKLLGFANANTGRAQEELTAERNAHVETKAGLRQAELRIKELEAKLDKATMPWDAQALQAVNEFIAKLTAVSPIPAEPEKREAWYESALKMFGLGK